MTTRQLTVKEMALLIFLLAVVSAIQAEFTYTHLARADAWLAAGLFGLVYAAIGGACGIMASSLSTLDAP